MLSETQINPSVKVVRAHVALDRLEARIAEVERERDFEAAESSAADIPGPCDETPPLFSQGGEATTFYAGKKFDRDNQLGNDGLK
jgi:hypothetical protein